MRLSFDGVVLEVSLDVEAVGQESVVVDERNLNGMFEGINLGRGQSGQIAVFGDSRKSLLHGPLAQGFVAVRDRLGEFGELNRTVHRCGDRVIFGAKDCGSAVEVLHASIGASHKGILVVVAIVDRPKIFVEVIDSTRLMDLSPLVLKIEVAGVAQDEWAGRYGGVTSYGAQDSQITFEVHLVALGGKDVELVGSLVLCALDKELFASLVREVTVMEVLDGLFEADGDEEAQDDSGDVDEEVSPCAGGVVGRVDVEHGGGFLNRGGGVGRGDRLLLRDGGSFGHGWRFGDKSNAGGRWQEKKVRDGRAEVADNGGGGCHLQDITLRA